MPDLKDPNNPGNGKQGGKKTSSHTRQVSFSGDVPGTNTTAPNTETPRISRQSSFKRAGVAALTQGAAAVAQRASMVAQRASAVAQNVAAAAQRAAEIREETAPIIEQAVRRRIEETRRMAESILERTATLSAEDARIAADQMRNTAQQALNELSVNAQQAFSELNEKTRSKVSSFFNTSAQTSDLASKELSAEDKFMQHKISRIQSIITDQLLEDIQNWHAIYNGDIEDKEFSQQTLEKISVALDSINYDESDDDSDTEEENQELIDNLTDQILNDFTHVDYLTGGTDVFVTNYGHRSSKPMPTVEQLITGLVAYVLNTEEIKDIKDASDLEIDAAINGVLENPELNIQARILDIVALEVNKRIAAYSMNHGTRQPYGKFNRPSSNPLKNKIYDPEEETLSKTNPEAVFWRAVLSRLHNEVEFLPGKVKAHEGENHDMSANFASKFNWFKERKGHVKDKVLGNLKSAIANAREQIKESPEQGKLTAEQVVTKLGLPTQASAELLKLLKVIESKTGGNPNKIATMLKQPIDDEYFKTHQENGQRKYTDKYEHALSEVTLDVLLAVTPRPTKELHRKPKLT